jgi:hypothetical protein
MYYVDRDKERERDGRQRQGQGQAVGAPKHTYAGKYTCTVHAPQSARRLPICLHSDDSSQPVLSLIMTIIAAMPFSSLSLSLPPPTCRISWPACFSQVNNNNHVYLTCQASAMTPRLPPLPSHPSPSPSPKSRSPTQRGLEELVCGGASPVRACIWPHASAVAARSVTRAKTIVRWAPETLSSIV